ncbi:unnamed protein product, partial [Heterobilharzia americana]
MAFLYRLTVVVFDPGANVFLGDSRKSPNTTLWSLPGNSGPTWRVKGNNPLVKTRSSMLLCLVGCITCWRHPPESNTLIKSSNRLGE